MKKPIAKPDWDIVTELACDIVNAGEIDDDVLVASHQEALFAYLSQLDQKYGEHPALLATRGDFTDDPREAMIYLERALVLARQWKDEKEEAEILDSMSDRREK